jgi:hypothetical protein
VFFYRALSSLIRSSHFGSPQNGVKIIHELSRAFKKPAQSLAITVWLSNSALALNRKIYKFGKKKLFIFYFVYKSVWIWSRSSRNFVSLLSTDRFNRFPVWRSTTVNAELAISVGPSSIRIGTPRNNKWKNFFLYYRKRKFLPFSSQWLNFHPGE